MGYNVNYLTYSKLHLIYFTDVKALGLPLVLLMQIQIQPLV